MYAWRCRELKHAGVYLNACPVSFWMPACLFLAVFCSLKSLRPKRLLLLPCSFSLLSAKAFSSIWLDTCYGWVQWLWKWHLLDILSFFFFSFYKQCPGLNEWWHWSIWQCRTVESRIYIMNMMSCLHKSKEAFLDQGGSDDVLVMIDVHLYWVTCFSLWKTCLNIMFASQCISVLRTEVALQCEHVCMYVRLYK